MKEIKLNPEGCKAVTIKVDGEQVATEFYPQEEKWKPKDGDFIAFGENPYDLAVGIFHKFNDEKEVHDDYVIVSNRDNLYIGASGYIDNMRPATEVEKQRLIDALAKEGKRWDAKKKSVEDLWRWRAARSGETYFYIDENLFIGQSEDKRGASDSKLYRMGNYFKTREAAERVAGQIREIFKNSKAE